eukprot:CAMPEP_0198732252 /NCGR_PEP_ID=MMETSP1475-20131203/34630_1 /TAXON_ID= ORGANISM="Unidentified sp., Strain CCMP1999" /NCGR_SAMPLE_ID=MMETSP1475 /ASSEMBLY_ACC=CAM_ASM_001111 /LENGTH=868 /DNA_ID=CAMNT_0044495321 /DNA_START=62 /DNA_END=2668 /DNA_ORIENTATION=-
MTAQATRIDVKTAENVKGYLQPPQKILNLVDAPLDPAIMLQPSMKKVILLLERPNMPSIAEVSAPELRLAGYRINATTYGPSRVDFLLDMSLQLVDDPERKEIPIKDSPINEQNKRMLGIGGHNWSPDGKLIAFCTHDPTYGYELWCIDVEERRAWCVVKGARLNAVCGEPFTWLSDSKTLVVKFVVEGNKPPEKDHVPDGPIVEESMDGVMKPNRTYQDLLKSQHDVELFRHYTTCQLEMVDARSGSRRKVGKPAPFRRAAPSPDGKHLLIDIIVEPFSYLLPASRFGRRVEVWDAATGRVTATVADIPLQDKIPIAFDGVGEGPRNIGWRADADATLYWVEAQDGGDPAIDASIRDSLFVLAAPFNGLPRRLASLPWRFSGVIWGNDDTALVLERWYKTRSLRTYLMAPGADAVSVEADIDGPCCERACDLGQAEAPRRLLIDQKNWEDRYNDPGSVVTMANKRGKSVLRLIYPNGKRTQNGAEKQRPYFLMQSPGASDEGDKPFLSLMDTLDQSKTVLWQSKPPMYENVLSILDTDEDTGTPKTLLIRRENPEENPNIYVCQLPKDIFDSGEQSHLRPLTLFPHPTPELKDVTRELVVYTREDGVKLNASLYLPAGYDKKRDGPLKMFMWAYPREFKSASFAGQIRDSPYRFNRLARTPLYWLSLGYAILDGPAMPVIGEGDREPNDTYVEQLVASARAAVDYVVSEGIARRDGIAIGGHSYGAFMTVTLLAHAPDLFCCGIARSGAYNRTLTPFGFQAEERNLWQATDVYTNMSPYLAADKIETPLLLVHGEADNNPGTFPLQSERLFQALKGLGKRAKYVLLPAEGHGYRARESTLHTLHEMTEWLERYCGGSGKSMDMKPKL